jgi:hypothetical protein
MCLLEDPSNLSAKQNRDINFLFPNARTSPVFKQMQDAYKARKNSPPLLNFGGQAAPGSVPQYDPSKKPTTFFEAKPVQAASSGDLQAQPGQSPATAPIASLFNTTQNPAGKIAGGMAGTMKIVP